MLLLYSCADTGRFYGGLVHMFVTRIVGVWQHIQRHVSLRVRDDLGVASSFCLQRQRQHFYLEVIWKNSITLCGHPHIFPYLWAVLKQWIMFHVTNQGQFGTKLWPSWYGWHCCIGTLFIIVLVFLIYSVKCANWYYSIDICTVMYNIEWAFTLRPTCHVVPYFTNFMDFLKTSKCQTPMMDGPAQEINESQYSNMHFGTFVLYFQVL